MKDEMYWIYTAPPKVALINKQPGGEKSVSDHQPELLTSPSGSSAIQVS